jgi:hypothetical protein
MLAHYHTDFVRVNGGMVFSLEAAASFAQKLNILLMKATFDVANEWFFFDGAHCGANSLEQGMTNTWLHENFVVVSEKQEIIAYFEGRWSRPMDIITGFRVIHFGKKYSGIIVKSLTAYFDYLFVNRGCMAFNWTIAHLNKHAMNQYDRFVRDYCGYFVGIRHHAQKSYTGKISDISLYEITREEYFAWKDKDF